MTEGEAWKSGVFWDGTSHVREVVERGIDVFVLELAGVLDMESV